LAGPNRNEHKGPEKRVISDIVIVGAGPAGLSAALYAARFCRSTMVIHDGTARTARIPLTHNVPGFDSGIAGPELLARMHDHAANCGAVFVEARVVQASYADGIFSLADGSGARWSARSVILATGVDMNQIPLDADVHEAAIASGVLRYCPVCDGFEHKGERIAVLGCDISGAAEALFLAGYSDNVTLLPRHDIELTVEERRELEQAGIHIVPEAVSRFEPTDREMLVHLEGHADPQAFDVLYPALGTRPRNRLAQTLGLALNQSGKVSDASPFGTALPGLYCAGDLVEGLDQISVAIGHGAVAATKAHNWLRECDGQTAAAVLETDSGVPADEKPED
jgi:thioredoxin reductase (NADPH)